MKKLFFAAALPVFLLAGCVSYQYKGETAPGSRTGKMVIYTEAAKVPQKYRVLGEATVSGNYQSVSTDRLAEKLKSEAAKCGASAILITERQVIPYSMEQAEVPKQTAFSRDGSNHTWSEIGTEVDQNIRDISFSKKTQQSESSPRADFKRIIRARYLLYLPEEKTATKGK